MHWSVIKNAEWRLSLKRVQLLHICAERLHSAFIPRLSSYFTHLAPLLHNSFQYTLSYYTLLRIMFSYWYCILQNHTFSLALHHVDGFAKKSALHFHKTFNLMQNSLPDLILYCLPNYIQIYLFVQYRKRLWMFCQKNEESLLNCRINSSLFEFCSFGSKPMIYTCKNYKYFSSNPVLTSFSFNNWQFCVIFPLKNLVLTLFL